MSTADEIVMRMQAAWDSLKGTPAPDLILCTNEPIYRRTIRRRGKRFVVRMAIVQALMRIVRGEK